MSRLEIEEIKETKTYYRNIYRLSVALNYYSIILTIILSSAIALMYFITPEPDYYATNSASAIMPLQVLFEPNYSPNALLDPDLPEEMGIKDVTV